MNTHEHEHAHEHGRTAVLDTASAHIEFEGHLHEQAAAVTMLIHPHTAVEIAFTALTETMERIAQSIEATGGIVGHIKVSAQQGNTFAHASIVQADQSPSCAGDAECTFDEAAAIQIAAIALLVGLDELMDICEKACSAL